MSNEAAPSGKSPKSRILRILLLAGGAALVLGLASRGCAGDEKTSGKEGGAGARTASLGSAKRNGEPPKDGFDELSIAGEYRTSVASQGHRVATLEEEVGSLKKRIEELKLQLSKASEGRESELRKLDDLARLFSSSPNAREIPSVDQARAAGPSEEKSPIRLLSFDKGAEKASSPKRLVRIPAASAGEATLLNGVFAPTSGEPSPVRLRLDAAIVGPKRSRVPLSNAFLIGKAAGDPNATRVMVELVSFSTVKPSGETVEVPVRGYVVGDDGMDGVAGTYLYRVEDQLPLVVLAEGGAGFTGALADRETTRSVTPLGGAMSVVSGDPLKFAGLKAASGGSQKIGEILSERLREIKPAVWTPAYRRVSVVFLEGVTLPDFTFEELGDGANSPFRDLDLHR